MDRKSYKSLREIQTYEDVQTEAVYYSREHENHGNLNYSYYNLYNRNFELLETVNVRYTNSINHLKRITTEAHKNDIGLATYTIKPVGNGFYYVISNEDTTEALKAICASVKPKKWR